MGFLITDKTTAVPCFNQQRSLEFMSELKSPRKNVIFSWTKFSFHPWKFHGWTLKFLGMKMNFSCMKMKISPMKWKFQGWNFSYGQWRHLRRVGHQGRRPEILKYIQTYCISVSDFKVICKSIVACANFRRNSLFRHYWFKMQTIAHQGIPGIIKNRTTRKNKYHLHNRLTEYTNPSKASKPCYVGIRWIAPTEFSQMSMHMIDLLVYDWAFWHMQGHRIWEFCHSRWYRAGYFDIRTCIALEHFGMFEG